MPPRFLYFDLGKVLLDFSVERMLGQIAAAAGIDPQQVEQVLFEQQLQRQYESGEVTDRQFYDAFCRSTGTGPDYHALKQAGSHIFELSLSIVPVVAGLQQAGWRMGILSNTCSSHWEHCAGRFAILTEYFTVHALSYQVRAAKPEAAIFQSAAELAGVEPQEIFFVDDTAGHVAGAKAAGLDAVQYTSTPQLVDELRKRRIRFNY